MPNFNYSPQQVEKSEMGRKFTVPEIPINNDANTGSMKNRTPVREVKQTTSGIGSNGVISTPSIEYRQKYGQLGNQNVGGGNTIPQPTLGGKTIEDEINEIVSRAGDNVKNVHVNYISNGTSLGEKSREKTSTTSTNYDSTRTLQNEPPVITQPKPPAPPTQTKTVVETPVEKPVEKVVEEPTVEEKPNNDATEPPVIASETVEEEVTQPKPNKPDYKEFHRSENLNKDSFEDMVGIIDEVARMEIAPIKGANHLISMIEKWMKNWVGNPNAPVYMNLKYVQKIMKVMDDVRKYDASVGTAILEVQNILDGITTNSEEYVAIKVD